MSGTLHIRREGGVAADDFRRDSDLFGEGVARPEAQTRIRTAMERGLQTRDAEIDLTHVLG